MTARIPQYRWVPKEPKIRQERNSKNTVTTTDACGYHLAKPKAMGVEFQRSARTFPSLYAGGQSSDLEFPECPALAKSRESGLRPRVFNIVPMFPPRFIGGWDIFRAFPLLWTEEKRR